ncbi:MAG: PQQ-binding-like beta-propeller repeat protein [Lentisphaeria bacterium]|nr:PQQ-binding-like beta-propeller repeat protein [Lentisphaeria bacterium]
MTPVSDGNTVYVFFGNGIAAAYDFEGKRKWLRLVQKPTQGWGSSASPLIADGKLIIHVNTMYGLDLKTGKTVWETKTRHSWGTSIPFQLGDKVLIATPGGDIINPKDGKSLIAKKLIKLSYNAPLWHDNVLYYIQANSAAYSFSWEGEKLITKELWKSKLQGGRYYASPLIHDGIIYGVNQKSFLTALNTADGIEIYKQDLKLGGTAYPSPVLIGTTLLVSSDNGKTAVIVAGKEYKALGQNISEKGRSSFIIEDDKIYYHGLKNLYCIQEGK